MIGEFEKFFVRPVLFCTFSLGLMGWMPFKPTAEVREGSALDFSCLCGRAVPAGT